MAKIRFTGSKEDGYTAARGSAFCNVKRVDGGWAASFFGNPSVRNPWEILPGGLRSQSCNCPTVEVDGVFKSRLAAAEEGLRLYHLDRNQSAAA